MSVTDSDQRRKRIIEAIVETYVSTATPVGSQLVARRLRSAFSPATIRNIMGQLELAGYLEQPHTSAGRVPTDRGYRYYVDSVMEVPWMAPEQVRHLARQLAAEAQEAEVAQLLERVTDRLSSMTQQVAFVVAPTVRRSTVRQVALVPLGPRKILCVLVAEEEMAATHVIETSEPLSRDEVAALGRFMNTELVGLPFEEVLESLQRRLLAERDAFYHLVKRSLDILQHALAVEPTDRLFLDGTSYVVDQPEFRRDPTKAHDLLKALEAEEVLIAQLQDDAGGGKVRIRIGRESNLPGCDACSCVTAQFSVGGVATGSVGILGPTRMDYRRMSVLVEGMARSITDLLGAGHSAAP